MCKITLYKFSCGHHIQHIWSACRGQVKSGTIPVCQKLPSLHLHIQGTCGSCERAKRELTIRQELQIPSEKTPTPDQQALLDARMEALHTQFPINNWKRPASPTYGRKPRDKRSGSPRKTSLLKCEVKAEDACGPEAFESDDFVPDTSRVYQTMSWGWDYERTSETKSLADEIAEDRTKSDQEVDGVEGDGGSDDESSQGGDDGDDASDSAFTSAISPPPSSLIEEGSVTYWYRQRDSDTRGKLKSRCWELVQVG